MSMDIFNHPPSISEDTLCYSLYPYSGSSDKASVAALAACIQEYVDSVLTDFLWHRDSFELKVVLDPDSKGHLIEGTMRVGDSLDDEWCTVWLLKETSSRWDLAINVYDSDGDFLLIEAAEVLPSWVTPSNSENRVWIYQSRLHLIPLTHVSHPSRKRSRRKLPGAQQGDDEGFSMQDDEGEFLAIPDALSVLRDRSVDTAAPPAVESTVWARISGYPEAWRQHVHHATAHLPVDIARALSAKPSLIQKAVEAFYTRDAVQLRAAHRMSRFPPHTSVLTTVKMTRPAYAQLVGQKFFPPKVFGNWKEQTGTKEWRWKDVGMKIAVGFEMLYQESKSKAETMNPTAEGVQSSNAATKDALNRSPDYQKYLESLKSAGYFQDEIEGSQRWKELEDKAVQAFVNSQATNESKRPSFASEVLLALSQAGDASVPVSQEDDDSWLDVDANSFEDMLQKASANPRGPPKDADSMDVDQPDANDESAEDNQASKQASRLRDLADKVERFVEGEGDLEGARFEDEQLSDEEFSDEKISDDSDDEPEEPETPEALAERKAAMDKLVPALEPSEYGQMPASYHSNSQRVAPTTIDTDIVRDAPQTESKQSKDMPKEKPIRRPILPRDDFDGVDSDDETDEDVEEDDEDEEDRPQVVGDVEIDMDEEEAEFLEFSRKALGISDDQWREIVKDREERGAFVPSNPFAKASTTSSSAEPIQSKAAKPANPPRTEQTNANTNANLDSFEAVMQAMDRELSHLRSSASGAAPAPSTKSKGKGKARETEEDEDIEAAMEAELKAALEGGDDEDGEETGVDYNLIKNFLESFKSQAGLSGPVGNLAGRLDPVWKLPRDDS